MIYPQNSVKLQYQTLIKEKTMKKLSILIPVIILLMFFSAVQTMAATGKQISANIKTKRVPAGTVIPLKLLDPLGSSTVKTGDQLDLMVAGNVKVGRLVVIPVGSVVRASVEEATAPKLLYKGGSVRLYFDHIVSPTGRQIPFYAGVCNNKYVTYDGALSSKTNYYTAFLDTTETTKNIVVNSTSWAWDKGDDLWNGSPKYVFAPLTAVVSAPVAGVYFLGGNLINVFRKGKDVNINQGETVQVQLLKPLDMPVY